MGIAPVMLQYWFRQERQVPAYLRGLTPREDTMGFNESGTPGLPLVEKTHNKAVDTANLHSEFVASGLTLTHASRVDRLQNPLDSLNERFYYVYRFHYFPRATAVVHDGIDTEKLEFCLEEINKMAFWGARVDLNRGKICPWISVSCKDRVQRFTGEDLEKPEMRRVLDAEGEKIGSVQLTADLQLHYKGDNRFELC